MVSGSTVKSSRSQFKPDANESDKHRQAKARLVELCLYNNIDAHLEYPVVTEYKTYYCDVLAVLKVFGSEIKLDLEVEDHDHSKHDFADAQNKAKELARYFIKTIWFKSDDIIKDDTIKDTTTIIGKIFHEMIDGNETDPRMNI